MALRVGPRGLEAKVAAAYGGLRGSHGPCGPLSVRRFRGLENGVAFLRVGFAFSLVRGTTSSELERTRGIRLFN